MKQILYIAGAAHCGSTVTDILLGAAEGIQSLGQLADLYKHDNCACGRTLSTCPLWGDVLRHQAFPGRNSLARAATLAEKERGLIPLLLSKKISDKYTAVHDKLFDAVFDVTGAETIVDSSKNFSRALALLRSSRHRICIIHLVRDSRGFINSTNERRKARGAEPIFIYPTLYWLIKNSIGSVVIQPLAMNRYLQIRFEDILAQPEATLNNIQRYAGVDVQPIINRINEGRPFHRRHIFSGNKISEKETFKFDRGRIKSSQLVGMSNDRYWNVMGWMTRPWGYHREPNRLLNASSN